MARKIYENGLRHMQIEEEDIAFMHPLEKYTTLS